MLFINPPVGLEQQYGILGKVGTQTPPLGLCYLAAVARQEGVEPKILDACAEQLSIGDMLKEIEDFKPRYVGLTATVLSIGKAHELAREIKKQNLNLIILLGGPQFTALPLLTMEKNPAYDIGIVGEGEETLKELLQFKMEENLQNIKGLAIRKDGKVILTEERPRIDNLDELPYPAWDLLPELNRYYQANLLSTKQTPSFSLVTTRGCPGKCIFCDNAVFGRKIRGHSADYILHMIRELHKQYGIKEFAIADDNFLFFKNRLKEICQALIDSKLNITFSCNARVDHIDTELLPLVHQAGGWQIGLGIESGSQEILNFLRKGITTAKIEETVHLIRKNGIKVKGFFMLGNPLETEATIRETVDFARKLKIDDFQVTFFTPLPGSEIYSIAEKYGEFNRDYENMSYWKPLFIPWGLTKEQLIYYYKWSYRKFYFRLRTIGMYLKRVNSAKYLSRLVLGAILLGLLIFKKGIKISKKGTGS